MHILLERKTNELKQKSLLVRAVPYIFLLNQSIASPEWAGSQEKLVQNFLIKFHINIIIHMFCCWLRSQEKDITILPCSTSGWVQGNGR